MKESTENRLKFIKKYMLPLVILLLLFFGAGVKYAEYRIDLPSNQLVVSNDILVTGGFDQPIAPSDVVVQVTGAVRQPGFYSLASDVSLRELMDYVGVLSNGNIGDFDFLYKPVTGDVYYVKYEDRPFAAQLWRTNNWVVTNNEPPISRIYNDGWPDRDMESEVESNYMLENEITEIGGLDDGSGNLLQVNINTADHDTLMTLPGIGEKTAEAIIEYRTRNGGFQTKQDILGVKGIGEKKYAQIEAYITV